jgi:hypothetical protein
MKYPPYKSAFIVPIWEELVGVLSSPTITYTPILGELVGEFISPTLRCAYALILSYRVISAYGPTYFGLQAPTRFDQLHGGTQSPKHKA